MIIFFPTESRRTETAPAGTSPRRDAADLGVPVAGRGVRPRPAPRGSIQRPPWPWLTTRRAVCARPAGTRHSGLSRLPCPARVRRWVQPEQRFRPRSRCLWLTFVYGAPP